MQDIGFPTNFMQEKLQLDGSLSVSWGKTHFINNKIMFYPKEKDKQHN